MSAFNLNISLYVPNANLFKLLCIHTCLFMALAGLALGAGFIYEWLHILLPAGMCGKITSQLKGKCRSNLCFTPWHDSHFLNWVPLTLLTAPRHPPGCTWRELISWQNQVILDAPSLLSPFFICSLCFSWVLIFYFINLIVYFFCWKPCQIHFGKVRLWIKQTKKK